MPKKPPKRPPPFTRLRTNFYSVRVPTSLAPMAPLEDTHASLAHPYDDCAACGHIFRTGDTTVLVPLGPGDDEIQRTRARAGQPFTAAAALCHSDCALPPNWAVTECPTRTADEVRLPRPVPVPSPFEYPMGRMLGDPPPSSR